MGNHLEISSNELSVQYILSRTKDDFLEIRNISIFMSMYPSIELSIDLCMYLSIYIYL